MSQKFFEDIDKNKEFLKYLDNRFKNCETSLKSEIEEKIKNNLTYFETKLKVLEDLGDLGDLITMEYYSDKKLYKKSTKSLKKAMSEKSSPYVPL
jgi:hypothetical protein